MHAERRAAFLLLAPSLALITLFFFAPVIAGFLLSLTDFDLYTIGDAHNLRMVIVSLAAALLVNAKLTRWKPLFRTVYFVPVVTSLVAVAIVFKYLYHPRSEAHTSELQ